MEVVYNTEQQKVPIKIWASIIEESAKQQLLNLAKLPFIHKHIAVMPDVHYGKGSTIGSVIATTKAIIPAAVGVDLGCGMSAVRTNITSKDLPENLHDLRNKIEFQIPFNFHSTAESKLQHKRGIYYAEQKKGIDSFYATEGFGRLIEDNPKVINLHCRDQLGSLGGGNHFIELCLDEDDFVWVMLHSGSRGLGNRIGTHYISKAKELAEQYYIALPDNDLAYLPQGADIFEEYVSSVGTAQRYAAINREVMLNTILNLMKIEFKDFELTNKAISVHHNYVQKENHFGKNIWVTRKGAVSARKGQLGIIPSHMGGVSFITEGKGNRDSFCSCSHGAGRVLSRTKAKNMYSKEDLINQTKGVECPKDESKVDEIPSAYKDINTVMKDQEDLVSIKHTLKCILNIKG